MSARDQMRRGSLLLSATTKSVRKLDLTKNYSALILKNLAGRSSNGRTPDSGSGYRGSSPCLPANIFPLVVTNKYGSHLWLPWSILCRLHFDFTRTSTSSRVASGARPKRCAPHRRECWARDSSRPWPNYLRLHNGPY